MHGFVNYSLVDRYRQHGRDDAPRARRPRPVRDGPLREVVNARLEENSIQSVNALARDLSECIQLLILW